MGFGLVEMLKNEMPLVWFSREIEKLNDFCFVLVEMLKNEMPFVLV